MCIEKFLFSMNNVSINVKADIFTDVESFTSKLFQLLVIDM